ncbi:TPA: TolC family protein [Citrobacter farmeri]|uniref:TolC family protein n=1 Tax=Citrobacter farmeri TaxID=67824 RepID=A0ACA8DC02_9ENTR|nr:TolC family protein [Citrobacter farmeri]HAT2168733.1 TolC family protein [Citrobacter freundii]AST81724.1 TolC family protein [Citrobacter farmeri]EMB4691298.1 TolC family protein [Citrobacter farmeri]MCP1694559.1 NodT family efflux transporter outer membrane factor (OMF) lipoprotein [Citrobacter farmeri]MCW2424854.1 NodT family efflux transporter outer membrane factor (OMF) lipoprotein [Citrobacter farmeri]
MKRFLLLPVLLLLAGCSSLTRSDYQRPLLSLPTQWQPATDTVSEYGWQRFGDPRLARVIEQVLESNNDLAAAAITVQQARVAAGLTDTNMTPDVAVSGSVSNSKNVRRGTSSQESYSSGITIAWELDLWGKLARAREQSAWEAVASEQDYHATVLTTMGTTAQLYWRIALYNQQIRNQRDGLAISRQTVQQVQSWFNAGKVGQLDVLQSQQALLERENQWRTLIQQRQNTRNALALLLNRPAEQHADEAPALDVNQQVPIAQKTPLRVIAKRPDIQAAESRLRAALAGYDASRLQFYPALSLDASLNAGSQIFSQWFSDPIRSIGGALTLPFIQWNTQQLTVKQADLAVKQAAITFRSTAYDALAEVDEAMENRLSADEQRARLHQSLALSQRRLTLTESRYRAGAVDFQTLLDAQDDLLTLENSLAQTQYDYLYATLQLWLAQGGGETQYRMMQHEAE